MNCEYNKIRFIFLIAIVFLSSIAESEEMIFGKEVLENGIIVIFEAAPKDKIYPKNFFLEEGETDIHIEMLMNWTDKSPEGSPVGGFIPYLNVTATITNQNGETKRVKLTPHLNLTDNFHYAQNIKLPGEINELYDVVIEVSPPEKEQLGIHYDWNEKYKYLIEKQKFAYKNLSFKDVAEQSRR